MIKIDTNVEIKVFENGSLIRCENIHNLITNAGFNWIRDILRGIVTTNLVLTHFALGTGVTPANVLDTTLETEVFRDSLTSIVASNAQLACTYYLGLSDANGNTITEGGLLTLAALGTLFGRIMFTPIVKTSSIAVSFVWSITLGEG